MIDSNLSKVSPSITTSRIIFCFFFPIKKLIKDASNEQNIYSVISKIVHFFKGEIQKTDKNLTNPFIININDEYFKIVGLKESVRILKDEKDEILNINDLFFKNIIKIIKPIIPTADKQYIIKNLLIKLV